VSCSGSGKWHGKGKLNNKAEDVTEHLNEDTDPAVMKRIAKKLCKDAVVIVYGCKCGWNQPDVQKLAELLQAKVQACTKDVEYWPAGFKRCRGDWITKEPQKIDDEVKKAREEAANKRK
jgi:hypothetical protein